MLSLDDAWNAAYHRRDPAAMEGVLADDWVGFFPDGRAVFKTGLLEGMRHNPPAALMFERHAARVHGDTGFTRGTLYANGVRVQSFFRVYARRGGEWRAVGVQVVA